MTEDTKLYWECTLGSKSHINLVGKVAFFPLIVAVGITMIAFDFLFGK